jgi:hypothetical protein
MKVLHTAQRSANWYEHQPAGQPGRYRNALSKGFSPQQVDLLMHIKRDYSSCRKLYPSLAGSRGFKVG